MDNQEIQTLYDDAWQAYIQRKDGESFIDWVFRVSESESQFDRETR